MKQTIAFIIVILSQNLQAACKCSCDPTDRTICASSYDIDRPCGAICPGSTPGFTPMITACPVRIVVNEVTGARELMSACARY